MTHDRGFHMKDRNCKKAFSDFSSSCKSSQYLLCIVGATTTYLVGTEDTNSSLGFSVGQTVLVTLQQSENIGHGDVLDVDLVLVIQV
jgi:hypothetical protein